MKQTAVDWLVSVLSKPYGDEFISKIIEQAKEMEKQQHRGSFNRGYDRCKWDNSVGSYYDEDPKEFEQYYNETYGK